MPYNLLWTGAVDQTTISTAGNWYDIDLASTAGAAPTTGDSAFVLDTTHTLTGSLTSADLVLWYFGPNFQGNLGGSGASITISASSGSSARVVYASRCQFANITAGSAGIDRLLAKGGAVKLTGGTTVLLECTTGPVTLGTGGTVTTLHGCGASIVAESNGTGITAAYMEAGSITSARNIATLDVAGTGTLSALTGTAACTTALTVHNGARHNHQSKGTLTLVNARTGSTLDDLGNPYAGFTVTNANVSFGARYFENATVDITRSNAEVPIGMQT